MEATTATARETAADLRGRAMYAAAKVTRKALSALVRRAEAGRWGAEADVYLRHAGVDVDALK